MPSYDKEGAQALADAISLTSTEVNLPEAAQAVLDEEEPKKKNKK